MRLSKMMKAKYVLASLVMLVVLSTGAGCSFFGISSPPTQPAPTPTPVDTRTNTQPADFVSVIAKVRPSVVAITTEFSVSIFGRRFVQEGAGSGWIIDSNGLIVTNDHVVAGARTVTVTLEDGRTFPAVAIRTDPTADLAVIRINAQNLPALAIGDSSRLQVGEWVVAVGNALGLGISATKGIVSALGVSISSDGDTLAGLIQTDAAINPGNSGGPLVNLAGEVVGINSAKIAQVGVEGMGYAIGIREAKPIIDRLSGQLI
ncbi:MAG: trypsin-like peptidase domain-containing protein [Chloroflexi bacterium]|nr:trypsin-like peptidase domain-containing protein [Chloroflexota bacterium]